MTPNTRRKAYWFWFKIGGTLLLVLLLLRSLDWARLIIQFQQADGMWLFSGWLISLTGILVSAAKWQRILRQVAIDRPYPEILGRYWAASFYNNLLPGSIGGDVIRIAGLARSGAAVTTVTLSVLADRATGLWAGMVLGLAGTLMSKSLPYRSLLLPAFTLLVVGGMLAVLLVPTLTRWLPQHLTRLVALGALLRRIRLLPTLSWSIAFQALVVLQFYVLARALQIPVGASECAVYAQATVLATLLPISLNGIGVREATLVFFLGTIGVRPEAATVMGTLIYMTAALASLLGAAVVVYQSRRG